MEWYQWEFRIRKGQEKNEAWRKSKNDESTNQNEDSAVMPDNKDAENDNKGISSFLGLSDFFLKKSESTKDLDNSTDRDSGTCMSEGMNMEVWSTCT